RIIILLVIRLFLFRLFGTKPEPERRFAGKRTVEKIAVKVAPVTKTDLEFILSYVGSLKAKDEINVFSKVTGKLVEYTVNEGDVVEKGQTIALVDRDETGLKYELAKVESPLSGIVGRILLDKGDSVLPSASIIHGTPIAIIVNMDEMVVQLNALEPDISFLKKGLKAHIKVDAYPDENFVGEVSKVSEVVDSQTRTLPIEITVPNQKHKLKSGMFARIKIIASLLNDRLVVPQDALLQEFGAKYVFVVEDGTAVKRKVTVGIQEDSNIEILEGLSEGENVIVFGQQGLKDGTPVVITSEE
ncbi:MAG: efflux RND transporter periplasmic adaptor subunit, partial [Candidatus Omnitrophica bacterium]|nr:efflux RND transporter periplasmic adaptor subunit [Candidatus Omnitrophota bacterium]